MHICVCYQNKQIHKLARCQNKKETGSIWSKMLTAQKKKQMPISTIRQNSISIHVISTKGLIRHLHIVKREMTQKLSKILGDLPNQRSNLNAFGKDIYVISLFDLVSMETNIYQYPEQITVSVLVQDRTHLFLTPRLKPRSPRQSAMDLREDGRVSVFEQIRAPPFQTM